MSQIRFYIKKGGIENYYKRLDYEEETHEQYFSNFSENEHVLAQCALMGQQIKG